MIRLNNIPLALLLFGLLTSCTKDDVTNQVEKHIEDLVQTGLPVVTVNTPQNVPIVSKEVYIKDAKFASGGGNFSRLEDIPLSIKGRGNSTWKLDKKPYKLKFDEKISFFNRIANKEWVLLANHYDNTLLRSILAYYLSDRFCNFDFTPHPETCELILNDSLKGNYQLCEQIKIAKGRVLDNQDGFLVEIDDYGPSEAERGEAVIFYTNKIKHPFNIKGLKVNGVEDVVEGDENYCIIRDYIINFENLLFNDELWLDPNKGYKKYIELDSFIDWYLINELSKNPDSGFTSSCYMNLQIGGKLKMGPLWDFDLSFGNKNHPTWSEQMKGPYGFLVKNASWFKRLFEDPEFKNNVRTRYFEIYESKTSIINYIDEIAMRLQRSAVANSRIWETLGTKDATESEIIENYQREIQELKKWLAVRMDWLKLEYDRL